MASPRKNNLSVPLQSDSEIRPVAIVLLVVGVVAVYSGSLVNDFIYDDIDVILAHSPPETAAEFFRIFQERHYPELPYYRPVTRLTLLGQRFLHGDRAEWFHLVNAILAGLTAWATYALLRLPAFGVRPVVALWGAALFVMHPCAASCVYPIASGRETLLPGLLSITAVFAFLRGGRRGFVAAQVLFGLALFSKEQAVVIPLLWVLADVLKLSGDAAPGKQIGKWLRRYAPAALLLLVYLGIRWRLFGGSELRWAVLEDPSGPLWSLGYAVQTIWLPFAELVYEPPVAVWLSGWRLSLAIAACSVLLSAAVIVRKTGYKVEAFWCSWFVVTLLPTANLLKQEAHFAERYVFLSALGLVGLAASLATLMWPRRGLRLVLVSTGGLLLVACTLISWNRAAFFRDEFTFYRHWVRSNPNSLDARVHLGLTFHDQGRVERAIREYRKALEVDPAYAGALINLGNALADQKRFNEAIEVFHKALKVKSSHSHHDGIHLNLGGILLAQGKVDEAVTEFQQALELNPKLAQAHLMLGRVYLRQGNTRAAVKHFRESLPLLPKSSPAAAEVRGILRQQDHRVLK